MTQTTKPPVCRGVIAVDVDQVVADLHTPWLARYNAATGDTLTPKQITAWDIAKFAKFPERIWAPLHDPDIYDDVQPIPGALEGVQELRRRGYRVVFVTSANPTQMGKKCEWLMKHGFLPPRFAQPDYIVANDKALIRADVLIDDGPHNIDAFPGAAIVFNAPYNGDVSGYRTPTFTGYRRGSKPGPSRRRAISWAFIPDQVESLMAETTDATGVSSTLTVVLPPEPAPAQKQSAETVLQEAQRLIYSDRNATYGHPADNFQHTADLVNAMLARKLREPLTAEDVGFVMLQVKVSREYTGGGKRDNLVDAAGYVGCVARIQDRKAGRE